MKEIHLSELAIKILLRCNRNPISKHEVTQFYKKYAKAERDSTIDYLFKNDYIRIARVPKLGSGKIPTYYFIIEKGKNWIRDYLKLFKK